MFIIMLIDDQQTNRLLFGMFMQVYQMVPENVFTVVQKLTIIHNKI